jgi:hypothetical protein
MPRICGSLVAQMSAARGQRVRKRQPEGGLLGDGGSDGARTAVRWRRGSGRGTEASSIAV